MFKKITVYLSILWITLFSINSLASHIPSCNSLFATDGGITNLGSSAPCVVNNGDNFDWTASDGSMNTFMYNYDVSLGSESIQDVANVIAFLTDFGLGDNSSGTLGGSFDFYQNDGSVIGSVSLLGKSDDGYGSGADTSMSSGSWDISAEGDQASFMTVKASTAFILYYFDPASDTGAWSTDGIHVGNSPNDPMLSHISWWEADGGFVTTSCIDCTPIPEPKTLLIFSLGLFVLISNRKYFVKIKK